MSKTGQNTKRNISKIQNAEMFPPLPGVTSVGAYIDCILRHGCSADLKGFINPLITFCTGSSGSVLPLFSENNLLSVLRLNTVADRM
jgi:hypothetical protein